MRGRQAPAFFKGRRMKAIKKPNSFIAFRARARVRIPLILSSCAGHICPYFKAKISNYKKSSFHYPDPPNILLFF